MDAELVVVRNLTNVKQVRLVGAEPVQWEPYGEELLSPEDAARVVAAKPGTLEMEQVSEIAKQIKPEAQPTTLWLANMTGDPDAPEFVPTKDLHTDPATGRRVPITVPNPRKEPRVLTRTKPADPIHYEDEDGEKCEEQPAPITFVLRPRARMEIPYADGMWFLSRDGGKGQVIRSRAPTSFEPDMSWSLDEIRAWIRMVDPDAEIGPDERALRRSAEEAGLPKTEVAKEVTKAKITAVHRAFLRAANVSKFPTLPDKGDFAKWFGKYAGNLIAPEPAPEPTPELKPAATTKKKAGRPKKTQTTAS